MKQIFSLEKGMTQAISQYSRYVDADITRDQDHIDIPASRAKMRPRR
jgi:hypothetical protein